MSAQTTHVPKHDVIWGVDQWVQISLAQFECNDTHSYVRVAASDIRGFERCPFCGLSLGDSVFA